jgi:hypothetical protein
MTRNPETPEFRSTGPGSGEGGLGPFGDHLPFALGDESQDARCKPIHVRAITANEVDPGILKTEKELRIAAQTVQFCHDEG